VAVFNLTGVSNRGEPFPPNYIQAAKKFDLCLMTTTQLFKALYALQRGELNLDLFWDALFSTSGVCPLPDIDILPIDS
jgi:hypothetical protein